MAIIVMVMALTMTIGTIGLSVINIKISRNSLTSSQSYYAAEAGVEDALLRLAKTKQWSNTYSFPVGSGTTAVSIAPQIGGVYLVRGTGHIQSKVRKAEVSFATSYQIEGSLIYGVQVGDGGMTMDNNSQVIGNVFSNSTISGSGSITDSVTVAGNGNKIDGINIGVNARVHTCEDSDIGGTLTYVSGGSITRCTAGSTVDGGPNAIDPLPFPITQDMINTWKNEATANTINGNLTVTTNTSLGPVKINGNLLIENGVTVTMTGTIWVTGTLDTNNNAIVRLDSGYGNTSGILIADGNVKISNNVTLASTGSLNSYLLVVGNSSSTNNANPAMDVSNNVNGAILFTPNGLMVVHNNVDLLEATAYQLHLNNNATVTYEQGLANVTFSSGPSGGAGILYWHEVP